MKHLNWKGLGNPFLIAFLVFGLLAGTIQAAVADDGTPVATPTETPAPTETPEEPTIPAPTDVPAEPTIPVPTEAPAEPTIAAPTNVSAEPTTASSPAGRPAKTPQPASAGGPPPNGYPPDCGAKDDGFFTFNDTLMEVEYPGMRTNDPLGGITGYTRPTNGTLYMNPDLEGGFSYMPNPGFVGTDSFQYQTSCYFNSFPNPPETKRMVNTVYLYVLQRQGTPPPPTVPTCVRGDVYTMYASNGSMTVGTEGGYLSNDSGYYTDQGPSAASHGTLSVSGGGGFTYTPDPGFSGSDLFRYSVMCGIPGVNAHIETATVLVHVLGGLFSNGCAFDNSYSTATNTALVVPTSSGFLSDDYAFESIRSTTNPTNGTLSGMDGFGAFTYSPNPGFTGVDTFTYTGACIGGTSIETATVSITVDGTAPTPTPTAPHQMPCATNDTYTTNQNTRLEVGIPGIWGNDVGAVGLGGFTNPANGSLFVAADGSFRYLPNTGFTGTDVFSYTATCNGNPFRQTEAIVAIVVGNVVTPTVPAPTATTDPDVTPTMPAPTATMDPDVTPTMPMPTATTDPSVTPTATTDPDVTPTMPMPTATMDPSVTPTMSAPTATTDPDVTPTMPTTNCVVQDDYYTIPMNGKVTDAAPGVWANDTLVGAYALQDVHAASHGQGVVGSMGEIEYTPNAGFQGIDTFEYVVRCDDGDQRDTTAAFAPTYLTATVHIQVGDVETTVTPMTTVPGEASPITMQTSAQPTIPAVSRLPVTGAGAANRQGENGLPLALISLLVLAGGATVGVGLRRHRS